MKGYSSKLLQKKFPAEYIKQGLNGAKAYQALKNTPDKKVSTAVASVSANRLLNKANVQRDIIALLPDDIVESGLIKQALSQSSALKDITYKDAHKYLETSLKLKGYLNNKEQTGNVNVAFVIKS